MIDPYKILGISKTATQEEIKKAYRVLVKKYHPDLNPGKEDLNAKFKEVSSAYQFIGSPEAREKFDKGETSEQQQEKYQEQSKSYYNTQQNSGRYSQNFEEEMGADFFENLFKNANSRQKTQNTQDYPGENHLYKLDIDFIDAALGADKEITLPTGKRLLVKIPAGINTSTKLKFKGQGGIGHGKGLMGDAFVEINVKPHESFIRDGDTIKSELLISFIEGLLGAEIKVPTIDGSVILKIQPGVNTGTQLRIRGKGVGTGSNRGDHIVILKVVLPSKLNPELQEAVKIWNGKFDYNPRIQT
jgi:DnaJ-class molecular chaperone